MDAGLMIRWGKIVPGREEQAIALFDEATRFYGEYMAAKKITYFEPFLYSVTDFSEEQGFFLVKGPVAEIFKLYEDERFRMLNTKAQALVEHFTVKFMYVGEDVGLAVERLRKTMAELHI